MGIKPQMKLVKNTEDKKDPKKVSDTEVVYKGQPNPTKI